jgi:CotH kinase protein/Lamin Tail Domain
MTFRHRQAWGRRLRGFESLEPRLLLAAEPLISEFMASNDATIEDGFGNDSDWIELYNAGDEEVDLQGYYLSDSVNNPTKWSFPDSTILGPSEYLVVFASDLDTLDPLGYYHTNYKLSADGEHVVLSAPDLTILSQLGPNGEEFPPQFTDVSYGYGGPVLVDGSSPARYLIPTNGSLGLSWTAIDFDAADHGFSAGTASVGYDTSPSPVNFADYFETAVPAGTTSAYVRAEFNLASADEVTSLNLNLRYDDGVVVYLNGTKVISELAPSAPTYSSVATDTRSDSVVVEGNDFSLTPYLEVLQSGKNVLAIHILNRSAGSGDLLIDPILTAELSDLGEVGYLSTPTPGAANSSLIDLGPVIDAVTFLPDQPTENQPITVTAQIISVAAPVDSATVRLHYRVMFGSEVELAMVDDGTGGDAVLGDGIYTAQIPDSAFHAGQMVRWYVTAADTSGTTSRAPRFSDPLDSPEYYGTVIVDPSVNTGLPVLYWFVEDPNAAAGDDGTRASLYMLGQFYDNIEVDLHGNSTTQPLFTKKSFNFDANHGLKFKVDSSFGRVSDFNLLTNLTDKTYLRNTLAYGLYTDAGGPGMYAFSAVVYRNGSYYGLYDLVEDGDEEYLERVGLDPNGALYKMDNELVMANDHVKKVSREYADNSDLQQVVDTASLSTSQGEVWIYDHLDIATWANFFAFQSLIANRDYGEKNYYLYHDNDGTDLWSIIAWDLDLSFGHQWNVAENYFDDDLIYNDGYYANQGGNHLINWLKNLPEFNQMYRRRLRTLLDEFYGPPGESIDDSYIVDRFDALVAEIGADALVDRQTWGVVAGMSYETPTEAIARVKQDFLAKRKQFLQTLGGMPSSQVALPDVTFGAFDYDPASGNQNQEYIAVVNHSNAAVDISGWTISGAVAHTFEGGTVIPANSTYYAVADVVQFQFRAIGPSGGQRLFIQGNYEGRLNNTYGELRLEDRAGATIATTSYGTPPLAGDYDTNGTVDNLDYDLWKSTFGSSSDLRADGNANGIVDASDYTVWRNNLGATQPGGSAATYATTAAIEPAELLRTGSSVNALPAGSRSLGPVFQAEASRLRPQTRMRAVIDGAFAAWTSTRDVALLNALAEDASGATRSADSVGRRAADDQPDAEDGFGKAFQLALPVLSQRGALWVAATRPIPAWLG